MTILDDANRLLDGLGATGTDVAATLANKGIRGRIGDPSSCPLAALLHEQFPEESWTVAPYHLMLDTRSTPLPAACAEFVGLFDNGRFPELEQRGRRRVRDDV